MNAAGTGSAKVRAGKLPQEMCSRSPADTNGILRLPTSFKSFSLSFARAVAAATDRTGKEQQLPNPYPPPGCCSSAATVDGQRASGLLMVR